MVDFWCSHTPVALNGEGVEKVHTYKFLRVQLNIKLNWSDNIDALFRKGQSKLFFPRRPRFFSVCTKLLQSVMASVSFFAVMCWGRVAQPNSVSWSGRPALWW